MKLRISQISVSKTAARRGARFVAAMAFATAMTGQVHAGSLDADDFVSLVEACVDQTSLNFDKLGAVRQAVTDLELRPLDGREEESFASFKAVSTSEYLLSLSSNVSDTEKDGQLDHWMLDPEFRAMILKRVRETNQKETDAGPEGIGLDPNPIVDENDRKRSYWWLDSSKSVAAEFNPLAYLRSSFAFSICQFTNVPDDWAQNLLVSPQFSFSEETLGRATRSIAIIDTLPSTLGHHYFLATGREKANGMLNAKVQMTHYSDIATVEDPTGTWVLTVTSNRP